MNNILELLSNTELVNRFLKREVLANLSVNQEALVIAGAFYTHPKKLLVVKKNLYYAQLVYQELLALLGEDKVLLYAAEESLRVEAVAGSPELKAQRVDCLAKALNDEPIVIITHIGALIKFLPKVETFKECIIELTLNKEYQLIELKEQLVKMGYSPSVSVQQPLVFSQRGSIIDIWPANLNNPLRIEFFDNELESMRFFDSDSQRTLTTLDEIAILPANDQLFTVNDYDFLVNKIAELLKIEKNKLEENKWSILRDNLTNDLEMIREGIAENHLYRYRTYLSNDSLLEYFNPELVVVSQVESTTQHSQQLLLEQVEYIQELYQDGKALLTFTQGFDFNRLIASYKQLVIKDFYQNISIENDITDLSIPNNRLNIKLLEIKNLPGKKVFVVNKHKIQELLSAMIEHDLHYHLATTDDELVDDIVVIPGDLVCGFHLNKLGILVITNQELFNQNLHFGRFERKFTQAEVINDYQELQLKDYVVHNKYGIGQYLGIVTKEIEGIHRDYLHLLYRNDATLYVPLEQFKLVRKFVSGKGYAPRLSLLGGNEWNKTKEKITQNIQDLAERLVNLYALRQEKIGFKFASDNELQKEFEQDFIYELTPDQMTAIDEIKADMMSEKPMDRLLCGDVGFGKTEVALRAAFKAVLSGKQVAYLCPTTILSDQHFQTFINRLEKYSVNVALLNRFVSDKDQKRTIKTLADGKVDILIGTHRILSKDVKFKDLGLLVIDEEQRFGVVHKEKIKELRNNIDVLSLSATPIPRTLQMSLIGIRSLSQLNTPPVNRISVQTYVIEKNPVVISEVIQRELARKGQVFYLHNNIDTIYTTAKKIGDKLPNARVAVAHGRMDKEAIEDVMIKFIRKDYDVLVCTTIIETGIDIPNANTILIDQADRFGLSQLYQIKGRVGRSSTLAYAYLMYTPNKQLTEVATKRLKAIKDFAMLGSGYKIAMRDLTIRGAGDMLGPNQSGFINSVGIDLYLEILNEAIKKRRGEAISEVVESDVKIKNVDAYIPSKFTDYDLEKIKLYQDIEKCQKLASLQGLIEKTNDLYGRLPKEVALLFEKKKLELLLKEPRVENFQQKRDGCEIILSKEYSSNLDGVKLFDLVNNISRDIRLKFLNQKIIIFVPNNIDWLKAAIEVLKGIK